MEFVADKGPLVGWELNEADGCVASFKTLRILGFKSGFATVSGVAGHYLVNASEQMDEVPETQAHTAPCIMNFLDKASPPVYVLMFKWVQASGKLYALTIPTDLKLSNDPDGTDKWVTPSMIKPAKLALVSHFEPIENRDGQPLAKKLDLWIKDHFPEFAALKLKSLANCRTWLSPSYYVKHVTSVADVLEKELGAEIAAAAGEGEGGNKKKSQPNTISSAAIDAAKQSALHSSMLLLHRIRESWALAAAVIAVPLGHRIIELTLSASQVDEVLSPEKLSELLLAKSPKHHEKLLALLQTSDKVQLLAGGKAGSLGFSSSPLELQAPPVAVEDGQSDLPPQQINFANIGFADGGMSDEELAAETGEAETGEAETGVPETGEAAATARVTGKRARKAVAAFTSPAVVKTKRRNSGTKSSRGKYNKTGLYSANPVKAAAARADLMNAGKDFPPRAEWVPTKPPPAAG